MLLLNKEPLEFVTVWRLGVEGIAEGLASVVGEGDVSVVVMVTVGVGAVVVGVTVGVGAVVRGTTEVAGAIVKGLSEEEGVSNRGATDVGVAVGEGVVKGMGGTMVGVTVSETGLLCGSTLEGELSLLSGVTMRGGTEST